MEIIEQSIVSKSQTAEAEDGIIITDDFIAVIDGSTSKTANRIVPQHTNGRYCMLLICEYIGSMAADIDFNDFCSGITLYINNVYGNDTKQRLVTHPEERLTASCIVFSRQKREIWMIGDCQCLIDGVLFENPKPYENILAGRRAEIIHKALNDKTHTIDDIRSNDIGRQAIIPEMIKTMQEQNKTYSVVDGFPIPMSKTRKISLTGNENLIVLASDGYPVLCPTLSQSEAVLAKQLTEDPLNINTFKATKAFIAGNNSFDDRAYVSFRVKPYTQGDVTTAL